MDATQEFPQERRFGWFMVALAAAFTGVGTGTLGSFAVFLRPMATEFGWLRGETTFAYLVASVGLGAGGMLMGIAADRFTTRPVVLIGSLMLGLACLLLSSQEALWQLYAYYGMLGAMGSAAFDAPLLANVGQWFHRNKGLALGLTTAGRSLGQGFVPFIAGVLIPVLGWRSTYTVLGVFALAVMVPLALLVRNATRSAPQPKPAERSVQPRDAAPSKHPTAWVVGWIGFAALFCCVCMATAMVHVAALAQDRGLSVEQAATIMLVIFVAGFFGRILYGRLADHIGGLRTYMIASLVESVLIGGFTQARTLGEFYAIAAAFGLGFSGVMTSVVICVREYAPPARAGSAQGMVLFLAWIGMGLGAWQAGQIFDYTGSYGAAFALAAMVGFFNVAILAVLYFRLHRHELLPALRWRTA